MALGLKSWIGLVAAGCAVAAFALVPPTPSEEGLAFAVAEPQPASSRLTPLLLRAFDLSRTLSLRDSLLRALPRAGASNGRVTVLVSPSLPASTRTSLEALLAPAGSRLGQRDSPTRLVVALVTDTLSPRLESPTSADDRRLQFAYLLPQATDGRTCLVMATLRSQAIVRLRRGVPLDTLVQESWWWGWWWGWGNQPLQGALLGPCAYYAAFGPAGRQIEAWLQAGDHLLALDAAWLVERSPPARGARRVDWTRRAWWRTSGWFQRVPDLEACAGGLKRRCADAVLDAAEPRWWDRFQFSIGGKMSVPGVANLGRLGRGSQPRLGFLAPEFLNHLLEDVGPERFAAFWRSDAPVEEAFAQAIGVSLGDWTRDWVQGEIGVAPQGPTVPPFAAASAVLVALALFAGGAALANRRVVG